MLSTDIEKLNNHIANRCPCFELPIEECNCNCNMENLEQQKLASQSNNKPVLLGLCGFSDSGKDTVAEYLIKNYNFNKVAFGDSLKNSISYTFDIPTYLWYSKEWVSEPCATFGGKTPRELLQYYGTDVARKINPDVWVNKVRYKMESLSQGMNKRIILTDIRFPNELKLLQEFGGKLVYVYKPGLVPYKLVKLVRILGINTFTKSIVSLLANKKYSHVSELNSISLREQADHVLYNVTSLDSLYTQIDKLMKKYENSNS